MRLLVESLGVLISPLVAFFVLRIRAMAPVELPDPSMHTIYIVDPSQMFVRYASAFASTARMREGAQAGFLVIARLFYLAFGAVPGFFATRYLFALIAIVPSYVLLRRLYGAHAGVIAIVVLLSCPVILTAWGTDYPDSAVVSYVTAAVACFAMPCRQRWRPAWLVAAGALLTLATWSHGMGVTLAVTTVAVYFLVRLRRDRSLVLRDAALLATVAVGVTAVLIVASGLVLGQYDFILPTIHAEGFLNRPGQIRLWHSSNWHWAPYVAYLLVPPSVVVVFAVSFWRRLKDIPTPQAFVGLACAGQLGVFAFGQFGYHVQTLEMHYFSSTIWGTVCLAFAVAVAELSSGLSERPFARWLPALLLLAVPLAYETDPHVPAFGWWPTGAALAAVTVVAAGLARLAKNKDFGPIGRRFGLGIVVVVSVVAMSGALLVVTVAPRPKMPHLKGLALSGPDPVSDYAGALGGSSASLIDWYQVSAELPAFVGDPTYKGEQLLMWAPTNEVGTLLEPIGMFHAGFDLLPSGWPVLNAASSERLATRRPAELLLMGTTGRQFESAFVTLGPYQPVLLRKAVISDGSAVLYVWLLELALFSHRAV